MGYERSLWFKHEISNQEWNIFISDPLYEKDLWINGKECIGMCLYQKKRILISAMAPRQEWNSILLHELAHAGCKTLSEYTILNIERNLISALLPHWKPPSLTVACLKLLRRVRRRVRRSECRKKAS